MKVIYKYPVDTEFELALPVGSQVLHVEAQNGRPQMWVLQPLETKVETRKFKVFGTGHHVAVNNPIHMGTWQEGTFVWHLFEHA